MPDNTLSTLEQIRIKIRRLTKSPSSAQISDDSIDDYINTFILYNFPEHLRPFTLRTTLSFFTQPFIDTYSGDEIATDFNNAYINIYENAYVAGYKQFFCQSREEFFNLYPNIQSMKSIGTGNDIALHFVGTLTGVPVLRNHVSFTSIGADDIGLELHDTPNDPNDGTGTLSGTGAGSGTINYTTGAYNALFDSPPASGESIYSQTIPYSTGRPTAILYYNNELTFRPIPDQPYQVELEVAARPTEMLSDAAMPEISQWWQYISYGAAKKVFEDRMDMDSLQMIMPEFKKQEPLVNRRTIVQQTKERTATIYTNVGKNTRNFFNF